MKYKSELIKDIVDTRGHEKSSLHYESECIREWIEETKGAYPKLCDYESEWLYYMSANKIGKFPYETVTANPTATINNVVPYAYKSAILKGNTDYRDIDTGEFLETFEDGRNLELVSVKMPVLTSTGKNLFDKEKFIDKNQWSADSNGTYRSISLQLEPNTVYTMTRGSISCSGHGLYVNVSNHRNSSSGSHWWIFHHSANYNNKISFTTNETGIIYFNSSTVALLKDYKDLLNEVQLEKGDTVTSYEPFKSNILTVNEDVELRGIGDVQDTLDLVTGELTQRIGEIVLDGSENWKLANWDSENHLSFIYYIGSNIIGDIAKGVSDNLPFRKWADLYSKDIQGFTYGDGNMSYVVFKINKTIISDLITFKSWLTQNPIKIQYLNYQESVKTVDLTVVNQDNETLNKIKPLEGTMNINVSGNPIKPNGVFEIPVEAIIQNLASFIEGE